MPTSSLPRSLPLLAAALALPLVASAADFDRDLAAGMASTVVSALEAGDTSRGLTNARQLLGYLNGDDPGNGGGAGLAILHRLARAARIYDLTADSPDRAVAREAELALRVFRSAAPNQEVRYPNGARAAYRFNDQNEWKYSNGQRIAYRPNEQNEWKYSNGARVAYRPNDTNEWKYPNGARIAYRPTQTNEWSYANGARIAYRPTRSNEWKYPNGRRICYRLGDPSQAWYYPDGTRWMSRGPAYSNEELADVLKIVERILEDSGWADDHGGAPSAPAAPLSMAGPAAPAAALLAPASSANPTAHTLRRLEREFPDRLRFARDRAVGSSTLGDLLEGTAAPVVRCYEGEAGYEVAIELEGGATVRLELDDGESARWETLTLERPAAP